VKVIKHVFGVAVYRGFWHTAYAYG